MPKQFNEIQSDEEYLRAVGMGPETHPELYDVWHKSGFRWMSLNDITASKRSFYTGKEVSVLSLGVKDTNTDYKWGHLANVLRVFGPEMDLRGWYLKREDQQSVCYAWLRDSNNSGLGWAMNAFPHLALLEAFYNAHAAQGDHA